MARAYSLDLRERVVASVDSGQTCRQVAQSFAVSVASVHRPFLLEEHRAWLLARLAEKPDLTLHALLRELRARDVVVSCDTLWRFLKREGISFKKNRVRQRAGPP